jgi:hypothetical protein
VECDRVAEVLPWLANGTLAAGERDAARAHLAACAACRRDLDEMRFSVAAHSEHLSSDAIVDYAFGRTAEGSDRPYADRHLRACSDCSELLALARESRRLSEEADVVVPLPVVRRGPRWIAPALAASLVLSLGLTVWFWVRWQEDRALVASTAARQREADDRIARLEGESRDVDAARARVRELEAENQRLKQEASEASSRAATSPPPPAAPTPATPELNVPTFDLYPEDLVRRGDPVANDLDIPAGANSATFVLNSQAAPANGSLGLEIADERGRVVWRGRGLVRHAAGDFTVAVPTRLLPPGRYSLTVYAANGRERETVERYRFRIGSR